LFWLQINLWVHVIVVLITCFLRLYVGYFNISLARVFAKFTGSLSWRNRGFLLEPLTSSSAKKGRIPLLNTTFWLHRPNSWFRFSFPLYSLKIYKKNLLVLWFSVACKVLVYLESWNLFYISCMQPLRLDLSFFERIYLFAKI